MSYAELELKVIRWSEERKIIPNSTPIAQWAKATEEMDELRDALENNNLPMIKDGVADIVICLINLCALADIDLVECLADGYEEIKNRRGFLNKEGIFVKEV